MSHMQALEARHVFLQQQIDAEEKRPHPDDSFVLALKKKKLAIKDELAHH